MKIISPTKTHLEISARSENNRKLIGVKRGFADEGLWALSYLKSVEAEQTFILMNPRQIKYASSHQSTQELGGAVAFSEYEKEAVSLCYDGGECTCWSTCINSMWWMSDCS